MVLLTAKRLRSIVTDCRTDADLQATLKYHRIKFKYTTETGFLSVTVPTAAGTYRIYRTASTSAPYRVDMVRPVQTCNTLLYRCEY